MLGVGGSGTRMPSRVGAGDGQRPGHVGARFGARQHPGAGTGDHDPHQRRDECDDGAPDRQTECHGPRSAHGRIIARRPSIAARRASRAAVTFSS
jgi:hypothetical protein